MLFSILKFITSAWYAERFPFSHQYSSCQKLGILFAEMSALRPVALGWHGVAWGGIGCHGVAWGVMGWHGVSWGGMG